MSKHRHRHRQLTDEEKADATSGVSDYWNQISKDVTGNSLFIDATAILDYHDYHETKKDFHKKINNFLDSEGASFAFITSTYVVAEVVRKIIHPATNNVFRRADNLVLGPKALASWVVDEWLTSMKIKTICVPDYIFDKGRANLEKYKHREDLTGWTLTDAISYEIVVGLKHKQIVSADSDFVRLGLSLLPY